ncbi:MAG: Asp-tRNA(Asn)/Glu-tRNA(Gln) amidotransferase subunit GatA [Longimicrobiales bacterium]
MSGLHDRSLAAIMAEVRNGRESAQHIVRSAFTAIRASEQGDRPLNAFLALDEDGAHEAARATDVRAAQSDRMLPLAGVPVAVKDNLCTLGMPATCGSRILEGYRPPFEATAVRRLRAAGAIIVGKTNCDEFAMGSSTENSAYGPTRNPHDPERVPGGSSGGSAAAVAAGLVPAALGSDTGGSVRQPAAMCGVAGIKPTYGRVSRYGLIAFGSSLDQVGTFGRTVADAAALLEVIAGADPLDSTCADRACPALVREAGRALDGLTIGIPQEYFPAGLDVRVRRLCEQAIERLKDAGARIRDVSLPGSPLAIPAYYVIAPAEASSNLARYDGVRYGLRAADATSTEDMYERTRSRGFGAEVKRRIMLGTFALSAGYQEQFYGRAQIVRRRIAHEFRTVFEDGIDALFTPTAPAPAFRIGEKVEDPYEMYLSDVFTVTANLAGIPGASVPIGRADGLPVGGQVLAPWWCEDTVVRIAAALERSADQ